MRRCSRNWLLGATSFLLLTCASSVRAQELPDLPDIQLPCAPEVTELRRAAISHGGQPGLWWHREVARCMTGHLMALPLYAERVQLLDTKLTIATERRVLVDRQIALAEQEAELATGALEEAVRGRREAEEDRDAWYRHPAFWLVSGVVVTVVLQVVAIWGFGQVK